MAACGWTWGFRRLVAGLVGHTRLAEAGPAASTPTNMRAIPAAAAVAAVGVAVIGVVASITIDGDPSRSLGAGVTLALGGITNLILRTS